MQMQRLASRSKPRVPRTYVYNGKQVQVFDDARTCFSILELFEDEGVYPELKLEILLQLLFADPDAVVASFDPFEEFLAEVVWQVCSLDVTGKHADECLDESVIDWKQDEPFIRASVFSAYGRSWDEIMEASTLAECAQLVSLCPHETPIGQAIYYRTAKPPKLTKYNAEQVKDFRKHQAFWKLKKSAKKADSMESSNMAAFDAFRSLERLAVSDRG